MRKRSDVSAASTDPTSETADRQARLVCVGVEASGYHLPLVAAGVLPWAWEAVEFNPAHAAEQRKTNGKRGVKTGVVDATAMFDLLVAGRAFPDIEISDVTLPIAALLTASALEELDGSRIENSYSAAGA